MNSDTVIVNVATHVHYLRYQRRFLRSLDRYASGMERIIFRKETPQDWPSHFDVPYGFKLHAIRYARDAGYRRIIWFDSDVHLDSPIDPFLALFREQGYYLYRGNDSLRHYCRPDVLEAHQVTDEEASSVPILGGKIVALDFEHEKARAWFEGMWDAMKAGEYKGTVSASSGIQDHRGDEAIGAILAHRLGMNVEDYRYTVVGDTGDPCPPGIFRTGYTFRPEVFAEHSVIPTMIDDRDPVLDVGARNFAFSDQCIKAGWRVVAVDADPDVSPVGHSVEYTHAALVATDHAGPSAMLKRYGNGTGNHLTRYSTQNPEGATCVDVPTMSVEDVSEKYGIAHWALVKLDCEGAEYDILRQWPGPIADQVSCEFHEHIGANPCKADPESIYREIFGHLGRWYDVVRHEKDDRHCAGENYWDTLMRIKHEYRRFGL